MSTSAAKSNRVMPLSAEGPDPDAPPDHREFRSKSMGPETSRERGERRMKSPERRESTVEVSHRPKDRPKRYSIPSDLQAGRRGSEKKVTSVRPAALVESARGDRRHHISFGIASLDSNQMDMLDEEDCEQQTQPQPDLEGVGPAFTLYGDDLTAMNSTVCHQPIGVQADKFIESLSQKHKNQLKKFLDSGRPEHVYYLWVRDHKTQIITVLSIKTLENHLNSQGEGVRRVKWRHLSAERLSIYRYSLPAITYRKTACCRECISRHRKLCLLLVWIFFVLLICLTVFLGSIQPEYTPADGENATDYSVGVVPMGGVGGEARKVITPIG